MRAAVRGKGFGGWGWGGVNKGYTLLNFCPALLAAGGGGGARAAGPGMFGANVVSGVVGGLAV